MVSTTGPWFGGPRGVEVAVGGDGLKNFCIDSPTAATALMNEQRRDRAEFEIGGVEVGALLRHAVLLLIR